MHQVTSSNRNEINVLDLALQLWRGKLIVILMMLISLSLGVGYLMVATEKWTSTATITVPAAGQVANYNAALTVLYADNPQDKPSIVTLQSQLFGRFSASMGALSNALYNLEQPQILSVTPSGSNNDALNISFLASSAKMAQSSLTTYIDSVNNEVVKDYGDDIKRNLSVKTRELTNTLDTFKQIALDKKSHRIDVIKQALKIAQSSSVAKLQVDQAEFLSDDTLYLLGSDALNAMINNETTKPLDFSNEYYDAQRALLAVTHLKVEVENLQSYRYISPANLPIRRDSPKKSLVILLSLICGAMLGSVIVLSRNAIKSYRK